MLRTALRPRFLGLLGLVLVVGAAFVQLGRWQLGVAESTAHREALEQARARTPVALTSVLRPHERFRGELSSRPVTAQGRYAEGQVVVPDRRLDGRSGAWVVTPFVVEGSGGTIAVLRGFVDDAATPGAPPSGTLTITGGLAPGESPSRVPVGPGELASVDLSVLVNTWSGDLYNGFVFLESEDPASGAQLAKVPTPIGDTGIRWRNAAYAVQWWIFAGFALWLWWRMVREEAQREAAADGAVPPAGADAQRPVAAGENGPRDDA
ncbi:SURF1 family protein [Oryzobacter telluris]|uniref:SURF1 family protein n=1 Tax=Oryzobacter telluris TaxID=3149179 RepID=UPI00370D137F